jgi:hypothetical protein
MKRSNRQATRTVATRRTAPANNRTKGARVSKGQPSQSTLRQDKRKGPNRMRAHRSRETGARRSCTRSALDQSPRPHPGLSDRRLCCTLDRRDHVQPPGGEEQSPTVGRVRLVHNNRPTEVDHSSHGVPMQIASIMLRGPAEAGRQRPVGVDVPRNVHSTNPWRFTDRPKPERRRLPTSIDPIARLSSIDTTTTTRDQVPVRRPSPILDRVAEGGKRLSREPPRPVGLESGSYHWTADPDW